MLFQQSKSAQFQKPTWKRTNTSLHQKHVFWRCPFTSHPPRGCPSRTRFTPGSLGSKGSLDCVLPACSLQACLRALGDQGFRAASQLQKQQATSSILCQAILFFNKVFFFSNYRMLQNNQLSRIPAEALRDLPNLQSL